MTATTPAPPTEAHVRSRVRSGSAAGVLAIVIVLAFAAAVSLLVGARSIPLPTVVGVLFHPDGTEISTIVHDLRLPRTVLTIGRHGARDRRRADAGAHPQPARRPRPARRLGGSSVRRRDRHLAFGVTDLAGYVWFALVGAASRPRRLRHRLDRAAGPNPVTLVLAGAAVSALLAAFTQAIVLRDRDTLDEYRFWVVGSIAGRDMDVFWQVPPFIAGRAGAGAINAPALNLLSLGDDVARSLGAPDPRTAGRHGGGHAARRRGHRRLRADRVPRAGRPARRPLFTGPDYRWLVPYSGLMGGAPAAARRRARPAGRAAGRTAGRHRAGPGRRPFFIALVRRSGWSRYEHVRDAAPGPASAPPRGWSPLRAPGWSSAGRARRCWSCWSALDLGTGDFKIPLARRAPRLLGGGDPGQRVHRDGAAAPPALVAVLVGAALALSGALTQTFARNPLASPDILGVTEGAAAGAVAVIVLGAAGTAAAWSPARSGARRAAGGVGRRVGDRRRDLRAGLAQGHRRPRLVLVGIGIGAMLSALDVLAAGPGPDLGRARRAVWLNGSLNGRGWEHAMPLLWALVVLLPAALMLVRTLARMQLGDDSARGARRAPAARPAPRPGHRRRAGRVRRLRRGPDRVRRVRRAADRAAAHRRQPAAGARLGDLRRPASSSLPTSSPASCCRSSCRSASSPR